MARRLNPDHFDNPTDRTALEAVFSCAAPYQEAQDESSYRNYRQQHGLLFKNIDQKHLPLRVWYRVASLRSKEKPRQHGGTYQGYASLMVTPHLRLQIIPQN